MFCCSHHPATVTPLVERVRLTALHTFQPPIASLPSTLTSHSPLPLCSCSSLSVPPTQAPSRLQIRVYLPTTPSLAAHFGTEEPDFQEESRARVFGFVCVVCLKKKKKKTRFNISLLLLLILLLLPPQLQEEAKRQRAPAAAAQRVPGQPAGAARLPQRHLPPAAAPGPGARRSRPPQPRRGRPRPHVQPRAGSPHRAAAAAGTATVPS